MLYRFLQPPQPTPTPTTYSTPRNDISGFDDMLHHHDRLSIKGAQWLSGRVLDSRPRGRGFEPHRRHCVVSLSKNIVPSLVLVQPRKTCPFITERLLMGRKEQKHTWSHIHQETQVLNVCVPISLSLLRTLKFTE